MSREAGKNMRARARGAVAALLALALLALAGCGGASSSVARAKPTSTPLVFPTRTPTSGDPTAYGWARVAAGHLGSVHFAASDPQHGYLCATDDASGGAGRIFGVTTDGGQAWQIKASPAAYPTCYVRVSPTDPLKLTVSSVNLPGDGQSAFVDAYYSSNGGQTWQAAPIPPNTLAPIGALWAGADLFLYTGGNKGQAPALLVSANGGAFVPVDMSRLIPNEPSPSIWSALAGGDTLYVTTFGLCTPNCTVLAATSDGGKTWRQLANPLNLALDATVGNTLYAHAFSVVGPNALQVMRSTDGGATWSAVQVPPLPDGSTANGYAPYLVAPDGTLITAKPTAVYVLRGQVWSAIPIASGGSWAVDVIGFATDASGRPTRVYVSYEGPQPGIFVHTL